ncbi:MAG: LTA synthase family protein [Planctomycetota bacterium]|nr:LTA synthase family protein [Planctomycetota bacterium]
MNSQCPQSNSSFRFVGKARWLYDVLAPRAYSVIMLIALSYTLAAKYFHSRRYTISDEYLGWVLADIAFLLAVEALLSLSCSAWPRRWIVRIATIIAAVICTWSIMNAAWLIRTGTQILPRVLLSLIRAPGASLSIVGVNLAKMPVAAFILLVPSAIVLAFFIWCLAHPRLPAYNRRRFTIRIIVCVTIAAAAAIARPAVARRGSSQIGSVGLRYNSQLRAIISLALSDYRQPLDPKRTIPSYDQLNIEAGYHQTKQNVVVVVLEGVQYNYTSLADPDSNLTPYMASLGAQGVAFSNMRSTLTHTTKALFALFTGRFPSASQDIVEGVPATKPYGGLATILRDELGYRTAFFQSAMGSFESRPGLVYNLGFEKFWSRDDSGDPNTFVGYLGSDEFSLLKPVTDWIKTDESPFLAVVLCSVTHDPYVVPEWFGEPEKEPVERYRQSIIYTDQFLAALDVELTRLNLADETIFCVIGDHGEAFGEHGQFGHERIAFDELLHIPFCLRAPFSLGPTGKITHPVSSVDLTPTLLGLLGFETESIGFDGVDVLGPVAEDRKVHFSGWMQEGPAGYVQGNRKFIYHPTEKTASLYDLDSDPLEVVRVELPRQQETEVASEIIAWRKNTIFRPNQAKTGKKVVFDHWLCHWTNRVSSAKYKKAAK